MLSHILYGSAGLAVGGLLFTAKDAGARGEQASIQIVVAPGPTSCALTRTGTLRHFLITVPAGTTEGAVITLCRGSSDFNKWMTVAQAAGDGSAAVAGLARTHMTAGGGLRQYLSARLSLEAWANRELLVTGAREGLIFVAKVDTVRTTAFADQYNEFEATVVVALAFRYGNAEMRAMEIQYVEMDFWRTQLSRALLTFSHEWMAGGINLESMVFSNELTDDEADSTAARADLQLMATCQLRFCEAPFGEADLVEWPLTEYRIGLFVEPLASDVRVRRDGDKLDQILHLYPDGTRETELPPEE